MKIIKCCLGAFIFGTIGFCGISFCGVRNIITESNFFVKGDTFTVRERYEDNIYYDNKKSSHTGSHYLVKPDRVGVKGVFVVYGDSTLEINSRFLVTGEIETYDWPEGANTYTWNRKRVTKYGIKPVEVVTPPLAPPSGGKGGGSVRPGHRRTGG